MMNDNKTELESRTELEQKIDKIIENARKTSNAFVLETTKLIKSELSRNKYSEKPISELEVLQQMAIALYNKAGRDDLAIKETRELGYIQGLIPKEPSEQEIEELIAELMEATTLNIKDTRDVIADVQDRYPTAQKGTIARIFKSLL